MQAERIQRLARDERLARHAGFWWGFAEGLFFFIVPDVYISFAALFSLRAGAVAWVASIAGSALAACGIYVLTSVGVEYLAFLESIPGISGALLGRVGQRLASEGLPYTPLLVLGGVPLGLLRARLLARPVARVGLALDRVRADRADRADVCARRRGAPPVPTDDRRPRDRLVRAARLRLGRILRLLLRPHEPGLKAASLWLLQGSRGVVGCRGRTIVHRHSATT